MLVFKSLKKNLVIKYKIKDLEEIKIIISWQIKRDLVIKTIKVSQSGYIKDFLKEENFITCNTLSISIKTGSTIKINKPDDYNEANLIKY